jgi:NitT/TauT family transport system substrate-binding protein
VSRLMRLLIFAALALAAAAGPGHAATKIVLGYTGVTSYLPSLVAVDQGFFAKRGLDVEPKLVALNSLEPAALMADSLQIGLPTVSVMLEADAGGLDLVAIAGTSVTDPNDPASLIFARTGSGIKTAQDLVGKRFGVPGINALVHVLVREWLRRKGVDYNKVQFVESPFPRMSDMLRSGMIDAVSATDPFSGRILEAKTGYPIGHLYRDLPGGIRTSVYATTRAWADSHREAVKAFRAGLDEGKAYMTTHPEAYRAAAAKYFKLPPSAINDLVLPPLDNVVTADQIDFWIKLMTQQGLLKTHLDAASLIFP